MHVNLTDLTTEERFKSRSSGLWRSVVLWQDTNVSEVHAASIFRVTFLLMLAQFHRH